VTVRRTSKLVVVLAFFVLMTGVRLFAGEEPLEKLIARAEAGGDKQAELYVDVARRYAEQANQHLGSGDFMKTRDDIQSVLSYAEKARATVGRSEGRIKQTELKMHKLQRRLGELARAADVDDRPPITAAAEHVQELRSELLDLLFRK
jgi:polyhydroxyalkanoate synthesis regulator phasin